MAIKRIATSELQIGMYIQKLGGSWIQHPFVRSSFLLTEPNDIKRIKEAGIKELWIDDEKGEITEAAEASDASQKTDSTTAQQTAPNKTHSEIKASDASSSIENEIERARKLCQDAKPQIMSMFNDIRLGKAIDPKTTLPLVGEIDSLVQRNSAAILSVARLKTHDDYTYMHSVAVCALMLSLANQMGLDKEQTRLAGIGGLMHDLGKAAMPLDILNKPGKLTDAEYLIMKKHTIVGAKILQDSGAEAEVIDIALNHHEKINGTGYPNQLPAEKISQLARMAAICDVYDAVTSERAYKKPWEPANTIREMSKWDGHFDKQIFNSFVKSVGIYPIGSLVRLTSQRLAVVIEPAIDSLLKPKVKVFFSIRSNAPIPIQIIDLSAKNCKESIEGPEEPADWDFKSLENLWL
ncbi:MAG TPA: HD-GYP domain-containing protein [Methylophaga aminisulfidivorans]|uniref:HD-GYP domain-containing protein n=1 Tax=Methylophaga TaxID=40222 RepID=UPI001750D283|nr:MULTISPECIES: HD-GYP domain-containing protein [Methylophaga]HIC46919.1 HD-GYP domain-containing protein [Methylophaga sp.]HIM40005.1 HD-GYP domain-containing protein [Methylophaga aminisulfidivorans]